MRTSTIRILASCGALAASIAAFPGPSAAVAQPTAPVPAKVELRQTRHADVDGDGRLDTVRVYDTGTKGDNTLWKVTVTTARGRTSSVTFPIATYQTTRPWYGWARLDGNRGAELLFETHSDDGLGLEVLTWSGGKLRTEKGPASPSDPTRKWGSWFAAQEGSLNSGYRFYTADGRRYVNAWGSDCADGVNSKVCNLETVRSVWRDGGWHTSAELPARKVPPADVLSRRPLGALIVHE